MISQEFKKAVADKNLLRVKIMLKDSFIVDPTFTQLNELLAYARRHLSDLFVPHDGELLENNETNWNETVMNQELIQLINNFSEKRIEHLKRVVAVVLRTEALKIRQQQAETGYVNSRTTREFQTTKSQGTNNTISNSLARVNRKEALNSIYLEYTKLNRAISTVKEQKCWKQTDLDEIESAAQNILKFIRTYKNNK